ncbi:MAG: nucleotidyl transferase AbiEii/AbiGii toxin family protein [Minisyncoccia bacterium]
MVELPIIKKLKKRLHREIAIFQDILVREIFDYFETAVLHGGTAIWRCYQGNRFSEDVDFYLSPREKNKILKFFEKLENLGIKILKKKFTSNAFYSRLKQNEVEIRLEVLFKKIENYITKEYETAEGLKFVINTLSAEDLIEEKVAAYLKRKMVRDLYDIYFLLNYADKEKIKKEINKLLNNFKKPIDEKELKFLIIVGVAPKLNDILNKIKNYAEK